MPLPPLPPLPPSRPTRPSCHSNHAHSPSARQKRLFMLSLQGNRIQTIPEKFFAASTGFYTIDLSENRIQNISGHIFEVGIFLGGNAITEIGDGMRSIPDLKRLSLERNLIQRIHPSAFGAGLESLPSVRLLCRRLCVEPAARLGDERWGVIDAAADARDSHRVMHGSAIIASGFGLGSGSTARTNVVYTTARGSTSRRHPRQPVHFIRLRRPTSCWEVLSLADNALQHPQLDDARVEARLQR